ncbi:ABC transporter substrate-binding protein [Shewanella glacialimarina]|jgi:spermidine/putrescine transport system substrate-binding protein|uniref:ABC transporter substrate-binding protein n=1 Tax=Shewanella glacialimarina TaxID=2590884 RepID=UPI001CF91B53|nr:extracellular solute-binding protein [Shewanella glacialimarina]UCX03606.1 extracellular solute-binding protein [Shewanella glacialimarina]
MQVGKYLKVHILLMVGLLMSTNTLAVTLNVLEWEGYISPFKEDFKAYAKTKGMEVELNIMDPYITDPELIFNKMRASAADVTTPTHNYYKMNQDRLLQVLQPIDFSRLTNYSKVLGSLRTSQYDEFKGEKYSVPLLGGSYGLAYNAAKRDEPKSWEVLWQPENKGKFAITGDQFEANIYTTLLVLGYPPESFYDIDATTLDKSKVQAKLDSLVQNADSFWGGMADVERMKDLELVTTYWFGVAAANQSGQNWKLATPKEGQTVWLDTLAIGKHLNGEKLDAAYLLLDFMISEPVQKRILEMYGSIIVNGETAKLLDPQLVKDARVGDETFFSEQYLWRPLSSRTRNTYKQMWNKAKAN